MAVSFSACEEAAMGGHTQVLDSLIPLVQYHGSQNVSAMAAFRGPLSLLQLVRRLGCRYDAQK